MSKQNTRQLRGRLRSRPGTVALACAITVLAWGSGTMGCGSAPPTGDAGVGDLGPADGGRPDVGSTDAGADIGFEDMGGGDVGSDDAGSADLGPADAGAEDTGPIDIGTCARLFGQACDGRGECGPGFLECADGDTVRCSTDVDGSASMVTQESCNGLDDDCDGEVDEDFDVGGVCAGGCGPGFLECADGSSVRCSTDQGGSEDPGLPERCDHVDNDCDRSIDEDFATGSACDGAGQCGVGVIECLAVDPDQLLTICSTERTGTQDQAAPNDLLCNGLDDDCDGQVDEDRAIGSVCDGMGACGAGFRECASLNTTRCSTDPGGSDQTGVEVCDGADNDCNGTTDDGFGVDVACTGTCGAGVVECATPNGTRCSADVCP